MESENKQKMVTILLCVFMFASGFVYATMRESNDYQKICNNFILEHYHNETTSDNFLPTLPFNHTYKLNNNSLVFKEGSELN